MERLGLVKSISVLSSLYVGVQVLRSAPGSGIKQLGVVLEPRSKGGATVAFFHVRVEVLLAAGKLVASCRFGSDLRMVVGLFEGSAPLLVD